MLLWILFAVLTAAVIAALMQPLRRAPDTTLDAADADLAVYRDQLKALETERDAGLVSEAEIEGARAEVARRLLKRAEAAKRQTAVGGNEAQARKAYMALAVLIPIVSIAFYAATGAPDLPARPFAERINEPVKNATIADVIARIEDHLAKEPDDGQGWEVVAPVYMRLERYGDAAHAFAQANRLLGESAKRLLGFAEATLMAEGGVVTEPVRKAAERVKELDPARVEPKIWLALAQEQDGDLKGAAESYRALLAGAPNDAPWRDPVAQRLDLVTKKIAGIPVEDVPIVPKAAAQPPASSSTPGPTAEDQSRAAQMTPEQRNAFIAQMVDRLAARLKENGKDLDGWMRLARAYKVLGRDTEAKGAIAEARRNFDGDAAALATITDAEKTLGLGP